MANKLGSYGRILYQLYKSKTIDQDDYEIAYDDVAPTYEKWLEQMGQFTDRIIVKENKQQPEILDLACGTGYISTQLLRLYQNEVGITAVDLSEEMLMNIPSNTAEKIEIIKDEALVYLQNTNKKFHAVYCGWALPYFIGESFFKGIKKVLYPGGTFSFIANGRGTLKHMERVFVNVMKEYPEKVRKPMDMQHQLLKSSKHGEKVLKNYGFRTLMSGEENVQFQFTSPEALHDWLVESGALAGTKQIFHNYDEVKPLIIKSIEKYTKKKDYYEVNHAFIYGRYIYQPGGNYEQDSDA